MSHFTVCVLTDGYTRSVALAKAEKLLAPFDENEEWFREGSRWDWYVVGGRWTGMWGKDEADPDLNPKNYKQCWLCSGTGTRSDRAPGDSPFLEASKLYPIKEAAAGCNGCAGTGMMREHRRHYCEIESDISQVNEIPREKTCHAVITADGHWHEQGRMIWFGMTGKDELGFKEKNGADWALEYKRLLDAAPQEQYAVLVDCHV